MREIELKIFRKLLPNIFAEFYISAFVFLNKISYFSLNLTYSGTGSFYSFRGFVC